MKIKYNTAIVFTIFLCILIIATFFDLDISNALYNSDSIFAHFFRNYGELPAFVFLTLALSIITFKLEKNVALYIKVFLRLFLVCLNALLFSRFVLIDSEVLKMLVCFNISIFIVVLVYIFLMSKKEMINELVKVAVMIIIIVLISNMTVQLLKLTFGRVRYRDLIDDYTAWYIIKGYNGNKSFPSGHTVAASNILCIILFYDCLKIRKNHRIIISAFSITFIVLTAISRIILGAHYLSDVTIGAFIGCLTLIIIMNFTKSRLVSKIFKINT